MPDVNRRRSPVVVAGMHRSGTSLAASIVAAADVRMGTVCSRLTATTGTDSVAYWNVPERDLELRADQHWAGGRPLRFFHYSGYDPAQRTVLSVHQSRLELTDSDLLLDLCHESRGHPRDLRAAVRV
jgi:hypothetical protein